MPLTSPSASPRRPRALRRVAAGALACAVAAVPGVSSAAAPTANGASGSGSSDGWWYDALGVADMHRETKGEGAEVLLVDGSIDTSVPELTDVGIELRKTCSDLPLESTTVPDAEHGTWMAALIAGTGAAGGIAGIAPDADLTYFSLDVDPDSPGIACKDAAIPRLEQVIAERDRGPILSLSVGNLAIGWDDFQDTLEDAGGVAVAAAGDYTDAVGGQGQMDLPAGFPGYVAVLALDEQARPWQYNPLPYQDGKRYLGYPTISAPGVDIPGFRWQGSKFVPDEGLAGTSPATALVAGSLALVRAKYPEATGNQLIQHLIHFDQSPEDFTYDDAYGFGVISLRNMMNNDPTFWPDVNPLLEGNPRRVVKKFPSSIYGDAMDAAAAADQETGPAEGIADQPEASTDASTEASAEAGTDEDEGGSALPWVVGGAVVLLLAAGAAVLARRRTTSA